MTPTVISLITLAIVLVFIVVKIIEKKTAKFGTFIIFDKNIKTVSDLELAIISTVIMNEIKSRGLDKEKKPDEKA